MRKIRVPVQVSTGQMWTHLTTKTLVDSAVQNGIDDESFEYSLNNFLAQSDSPNTAKEKFKAEALNLWRHEQRKATEAASQYIN